VEQLSGKQLQLREEVRERERIIQQLQEETASLAEQHQEAMREVDRHRSTTSSLQADLLSSQSRCDTLNQEVSLLVSTLTF
jgi:predicted RNase H-like nuclease (RuvC/YqgF family)